MTENIKRQERSHEKAEAEIGAMLSQTKELSELEEVRKDSLLEPSDGAWFYKHLGFGLLDSRL